MDCRRIWAGWLGVVTGVFCAAQVAPAQVEWHRALETTRAGPLVADSSVTLRAALFRHRSTTAREAAAQVPLNELSAGVRGNVQLVLERPTLFIHGPSEVFTCCPALYHWLLGHPDQAVVVWRRLGARCADIKDRGDGIFGWTDGQGSDVRWWTIHRSREMRVWYAEGNARAAGILPLVPVRAVVIMHHYEARSPTGRTLIQHQADLFLQTDSRAAALVTRMLGASAPRMAEQGAGQMEMFFSALSWYIDQHPEKAERLLSGVLAPDAPAWEELRQRKRTPRTGGTAIPATIIHSGA